MVIANVRGNVRATARLGRHDESTASGDLNEVVLHELGHAFGDLDDEYADVRVNIRRTSPLRPA